MKANYWQSECGKFRIYHGDCLDILPTIQPTGRRVLVTDPPYSSGGFQESGKASGSIGVRDKEQKIETDTLSTEAYIELMRRVTGQSRAQAAYAFTDWRMWNHTKMAVELGGLRAKNMLTWDKGGGGMGRRWTTAAELILWAACVSAETTAMRGSVLRFSRTGNINHPTEKPVELMTAIISNAEPGEIIDPFAGSGTTGVACVKLGRNFVGIEKSRKHFDRAVERIQAELEQSLPLAPPTQPELP